jgi:hypothetical protein
MQTTNEAILVEGTPPEDFPHPGLCFEIPSNSGKLWPQLAVTPSPLSVPGPAQGGSPLDGPPLPNSLRLLASLLQSSLCWRDSSVLSSDLHGNRVGCAKLHKHLPHADRLVGAEENGVPSPQKGQEELLSLGSAWVWQRG